MNMLRFQAAAVAACLAAPVAAGSNPPPQAVPGFLAVNESSCSSHHHVRAKHGQVLSVTMDINPGVSPNIITPGSTEIISVAVFSKGRFNATAVDPLSVLFGANGTEAAPLNASRVDVDGDGRLDRVFQFETQYTGIVCGSTSAMLTGKTFKGRAIKASDVIETQGC